MRALTVAGLLLAAACSREPRLVTITVHGPPEPEWLTTVSPCLDPSWGWTVHGRSREPNVARVRIPAAEYTPERARPVLDCLRTRPGVTRVDPPAS